jgi:urease accessory protein
MRSIVQIHAGSRNGNTFLKRSFCTPPFKVADITEDKKAHECRVMLMSSSPGVLDGDEYALTIELDERSFLHLETQSYQRLFQMQKNASQSLEVQIRDGAFFYFLPHPSVPHKGSSFETKNKFYLAKQSGLLYGEVLTSGRKLNGESFLFSSYHSCTEVFKQGRLVVKENLWMTPAISDPCSMGQLEGYSHQASLIFIKDGIDIQESLLQLHCLLEVEENILFGCTRLPVNGLLVRLLGSGAEQLFGCLKKIGDHLKKECIQSIVYAE